MTDLATVIWAQNEARVAEIGRQNVDWRAVNEGEAALRSIGLRDALAGELALSAVLDGKRVEIIAVDPA